MAIFAAGSMLLLSIWGKHSGLSMDLNKEMIDVHKCMEMLKSSERRCRSVGKLWFVVLILPNNLGLHYNFGRDILCELSSVGKLPLPQISSLSTQKRKEDCEPPLWEPMIQGDAPGIIAGSGWINRLPGPSFPDRAGQSYHQPNQHQQDLPPLLSPSVSMSHSEQASSLYSMTSSVLPVFSVELEPPTLHGHLKFSGHAYLDQAKYWYQSNPIKGSGGS